MARFLSIAALALLGAAGLPPAAPNPIDDYYKGEDLPPADDYEFFRRLHVDVSGRLPAVDALRAFAADTARDKRAKAVDTMLTSDAALEFAADVWLRHLIDYELKETDPYQVNFPAFRKWLKKAFADDLPYDQLVRALIGSTGNAAEQGGANFVLKHLSMTDPPTELAARTSRLFLGYPMQCAQCHNHPYEKWKQDDFWGLVGFYSYARPRLRKNPDGYKASLTDRSTPVKMQKPGRPSDEAVVTRFIDGRTAKEGQPPREALAEFITTAPDHQFARNIVNRTWASLMGWGFVEPLDGFGDHARRRDGDLLEVLTTSFEKGGYRIRELQRLILTSKAYQVSSRAAAAKKLHAPRGMSVPQFTNILSDMWNLKPFLKVFYGAYLLNPALPEPYKNPEVFDLFIGRYVAQLMTSRNRAPDDYRSPGTMRLALRLMNNRDLLTAAYAPGAPYGKILKQTDDTGERIDLMYLTFLSRPPSAEERGRMLDFVKSAANEKRAFQDVFWVLVNSSEFYFIH